MIQHTIMLPDITTTNGVIINGTHSSTTADGNWNISLDTFMIDGIAQNIIIREMMRARTLYPEVDFRKIQDMLDSRDVEMRDLGITTLSKYTLYAWKIIEDQLRNGGHSVYWYIQDFLSHNRTNIMEDVK